MTDKSSNPAMPEISGFEFWAKAQLNEAHKALDALGVPTSENRPDWRHPSGSNDFTLGVPERINWLRHNWQPKPKT